MLYKRKSGILYPIHSFFKSQKYDLFVGDWGNTKVIDFIKNMGFKILQILPINPVCRLSFSPYSGNSAFGLEHALVSVDKLIQNELLTEHEAEQILAEMNVNKEDYQSKDKIDYNLAIEFKTKALYKAFKKNSMINRLEKWAQKNPHVHQYCLYLSIKQAQNNKPWYEWDENFKNYHQFIINYDQKIDKEIYYFYLFCQYISYRQYTEFKNYANSKGILIIGDIPIYVSHDSCDVWANREIFKLQENGYPEFVAGVPPDYFSDTGQLWGNPVYNWDKLKEQNFKWWISRLRVCFELYDWVRIDHFRGLVAYWQVRYGEETAVNGQWIPAYPYEFIDTLLDYKSLPPIIAEDLGIITPDVEEFRDYYNIPGMRVLQFAFSDPSNIHLPHHYSENLIAYTGTHDNNTTKGWFRTENPNIEFIKKYLNKYDLNEENIVKSMITLLLESIANLVIIPIQDILELDENYRINKPGTSTNNWIYRDNILPIRIDQIKQEFYEYNKVYQRL